MLAEDKKDKGFWEKRTQRLFGHILYLLEIASSVIKQIANY